ATAWSDYSVRTGTLTFNPGVTSLTVGVPTLSDPLWEPTDETFFLNLSAPTNATLARVQGVGTIHDVPTPPTVTYGTFTPVTEGDSASVFASVPIVLSHPWTSNVTLNVWATSYTAVAGADFVRLNQPV